jgi:hypothetical protein
MKHAKSHIHTIIKKKSTKLPKTETGIDKLRLVKFEQTTTLFGFYKPNQFSGLEKTYEPNNDKPRDWDLTLSLMLDEACNVMILRRKKTFKIDPTSGFQILGWERGKRSFRATVKTVEMRKFSDFEFYIGRVWIS